MSDKPKIGISIGDVNGIGLEIIIKTLADTRIYDYCTPIVYGHTKVASFHRRATHISEFNFNVIDNPTEAQHRKANMINCWEEDVRIEPGQITADGGKYAYISLQRATDDLLSGILTVL
jgi:4-hydroxy-L-threonine phosphate dehydrogenase PdxA